MASADAVTVDPVVVGSSARMRAILDVVRLVSAGDSALLLTGEPGTGKELVASVVHRSSARRDAPFVSVSCADVPAALVGLELLGHERGAWGSSREHQGWFEQAHGGTLFLDDIDEASAGLQVRLARVLQERAVERLGGERRIPVDVRVIAASRRDLRRLVTEGAFREDLFHRLDVVSLSLPPLRDRREDIPALLRHFVQRSARQRGSASPEVPPHVEQAFQRYAWPGNVRELENVCERAVQTCTCGVLRTGCVAAHVLFDADAPPQPAVRPGTEVAAGGISLDDRLRDVEAGLIGWALRAADGNKSRAAELLHIKRTTLADRISRHGARLQALAGGVHDGEVPA